jgi:hypothetical protein
MKVDEISQAERRRVLANDRKVAEERKLSTLLDHANASADDLAGGRFAAITKTTVTGSSPISYPRLPADSPSNQAMMVPDEAPLGFDINAMDPVGEPHERGDAAATEEGGLRRRGWRRL